ncbi:MAG: hypothetical protein JSR46_00910 [Verrucomicrobia bacterium]|nr:hypothetical protein [Verrucomicrobiota bacterium]
MHLVSRLIDSELDPVVNENVPLQIPTQTTGYMGRAWEWLKSQPTEGFLRGVFGTASAVATTVLGCITVRQFCQDSFYHSRGTLEGALLGMSITVLTGCLLPTHVGTYVADWLSRWSFEVLQVFTQLYLNAGWPIDGKGLWNTQKSPLSVKESGMLFFSALSSSLALISMRPIVFPPEDIQEANIQIENIDDYLEQDPEPVALWESGRRDTKQFIIEQALKAVPGILLTVLQKTDVLQDPEWLFLGYYLTGHCGGVVIAKIYQIMKDHVLGNCLSKRHIVDLIDKIGHISLVTTIGLFFGLTDSTTFLALGAISGMLKMVALRKFEHLRANSEQVEPFTWMRVDNIAKGTLLALTLVWYIAGMTDSNMTGADYANIIAYFASTVASYILTRHLASEFVPRQNSTLFNTLRFYFVDYTEMLIVPYMFIRTAQGISDESNDPRALVIAENLMAWISFGLATGNNRALNGIRNSRSPNEMSELALYVGWSILSSQQIR